MITNEMILNGMKHMTIADIEDYLDAIGIEHSPREKKDSLYQKAVDSIKGDEDILRLTNYVCLTSHDVMEALEITRYRFNKMLDEGVISPDKTYHPNVYAGGRKPVAYLFYGGPIIKLIQSGKYDAYKRK